MPTRLGLICLLAFLLPHSPWSLSQRHPPDHPPDPSALVLHAAQQSEQVRIEALSRRVSDRVRALQEEADRLAGQGRTLLGDIRALEIDQQLQAERARQADADVQTARTALQQADAKLSAIEAQRVEQLPDVSGRLVELYKQGRGGYARLLLNANSLRDLGRTTRAVASLAHLNQERLLAHRRTLDALRQEQKALGQKNRELEKLQADAQRARLAADRAVEVRTAMIADVDRRRDLNAQLVGELQAAQQKLTDTVANLRLGKPADAVSVPILAFRGTLDWPAVGPVASRFGRPAGRAADAASTIAARSGIEISVPEGTPVRAVHPGTVGFADIFAGYGTLVIVDHGANYFSLYGYLGTAGVQRDQRVDTGDELGRVGFAPAGPPALYFEMRVDGRSVDPVQWLKPR